MILLLTSNDYWGAKASAPFREREDITVAIDTSGSLARSLKLVARGSVPLMAAIKIQLAGLRLPKEKPQGIDHYVSSNEELRALCKKVGASTIVMYRAGLIISKKTMVEVTALNIHCADIPEFGGLGAIYRALSAGKMNQNATLHHVTDRIDDGEVLAVESYALDNKRSYAENEAVAYEAGIRLLSRHLSNL